MPEDYDDLIRRLEQLGENGLSLDGDVEENDAEEYDDGMSDFLLGYDKLNPYVHEEENGGVTIELGHTGVSKLKDELPVYISRDDIDKYASIIYPERKIVHSLILEVFTPEQLLEFEKLQRNLKLSNNKKVVELERLLKSWGKEYTRLGPGTNRLGLLLDGYTIKIALDADGEIDNKREFIYSMQLYPYVIKCYECIPNGLCAIFEYVEVFSIDDYHKCQDRMREILTDIASGFLIGDVGVSSKNYMNWGHRDDEICILDFAYIYSVKFKTFTCQCSVDAVLHYDKDFNNLICPICGKKYSFKDIRKKISRKDQDMEIGDIREKGYVISSSYQEVDFNPNFTDGAPDKIYKELIKMKKKQDKKLRLKENKYDPEDHGLDVDQILEKIYSGEMRPYDE